MGARASSIIDDRAARARRRERLNDGRRARFAVLRPLRVVIDNFPEGLVEDMDAVNNPEDPDAGTRKVPFTRGLYIERDDFREDPPRSFSGSPRAARCGCGTRTSSPVPTW